MIAVASVDRKVVIKAPSSRTLSKSLRPLSAAAPAASAAAQSKNRAMSATAAVNIRPRKNRKRFPLAGGRHCRSSRADGTRQDHRGRTSECRPGFVESPRTKDDQNQGDSEDQGGEREVHVARLNIADWVESVPEDSLAAAEGREAISVGARPVRRAVLQLRRANAERDMVGHGPATCRSELAPRESMVVRSFTLRMQRAGP